MTKIAQDKYAKAIRELRKIPCKGGAFRKAVNHAWNNPGTELGVLFNWCSRSHYIDSYAGCLTMVKEGCHPAGTPQMTRMIRADERIPDHLNKITKKSLTVFREYQMLMDKRWKRP